MEPIGSDLSCNICCDLLKTEKFATHMKIHEKYLNLDASVDCPSCKENVCKRQLNAHFAQVRYKYIKSYTSLFTDYMISNSKLIYF